MIEAPQNLCGVWAYSLYTKVFGDFESIFSNIAQYY